MDKKDFDPLSRFDVKKEDPNKPKKPIDPDAVLLAALNGLVFVASCLVGVANARRRKK